MTHHIDIQIACEQRLPVSEKQLTDWVNVVLEEHQEAAELTVRIVETEEITELNKLYRKKDMPTNVLAFPSELPDTIELEYPLLGDVIVCPAVLEKESIEQKKSLEAHWAHIVMHGVLHLLGYDHIEEKDAHVMEAMEIKLLAQFGIADPYLLEGE